MVRLSGLLLIALCLVHCTSGDVFCDKKEMEIAWKLCERAYQPSDLNNITIQEMCSNIDCLIQCKIDAVGDCAESDTFLDKMQAYDPVRWKVYFRIACSDVTFATKQFESKDEMYCEANDSLCSSDELSRRYSFGLRDLYNKGKYEEYKELLCNTSAIQRDCLQVFPTANCSDSSARQYSDIVKISSSFSFCENEDIKHLYTEHGGDTKCINTKLDSRCFKSSIMSRVSKCSTFSLHTLVDQRLSPNIDEFCNSQECNIKCYEEAVKDCSEQEKHFDMDPVAVKVANRATCDNKEELKTAVTECSIRNTTCSAEYNKSLSEADVFLQQLNYANYRQTICSATSKFIDCVDYVITGKCTEEMATILKDMITVTFSYSKCGQQNHAYFSKHGAETNCVTSGSNNILINSFLSMFMLFVIVVVVYIEL